jgi:hypothetical protein
MLKAFLKAEIQGWTDVIKNPESAIDLDLKSYGSDLGLNRANEVQSAHTANDSLITSSDTQANGLFTVSDSLQQETVKSLAGAGVKVTASDLFDMSLLAAVYKDNPELKNYQG